MIDIKAILKKHNITRDDMLRNDWQVKMIDLMKDCMTETVMQCIEASKSGSALYMVVADIEVQISAIKTKVKPLPEAWDK